MIPAEKLIEYCYLIHTHRHLFIWYVIDPEVCPRKLTVGGSRKTKQNRKTKIVFPHLAFYLEEQRKANSNTDEWHE